jgi:hypothetical protein
MRRGLLPPTPCRHARVDGPKRPSGRNASPSGITPSTIMSPTHNQTGSRTEIRLGARAHTTPLLRRAHSPPAHQPRDPDVDISPRTDKGVFGPELDRGCCARIRSRDVHSLPSCHRPGSRLSVSSRCDREHGPRVDARPDVNEVPQVHEGGADSRPQEIGAVRRDPEDPLPRTVRLRAKLGVLLRHRWHRPKPVRGDRALPQQQRSVEGLKPPRPLSEARGSQEDLPASLRDELGAQTRWTVLCKAIGLDLAQGRERASPLHAAAFRSKRQSR